MRSAENAPLLPRRPYGKTGVKPSVIGPGGIVVMGAEQKRANRAVAEAVEKGVNYFDVAPTYGDAELKLAPAVQSFRKKAFAACKTTQRKRDAALALRFALSQPVTAAIPPGEESLFRLAGEHRAVRTSALKVKPLLCHGPEPKAPAATRQT